VAIVGHLAGAAIGLNLAVGAAAQGLPVPKLVFALMPGGVATDPKSRGIPLADLSGLDPKTMLVAMSPDREHLASDRLGRRILKEATSVPAERKLFMRVLSDDHGFPALSATLASPGSVKEDYDGRGSSSPRTARHASEPAEVDARHGAHRRADRSGAAVGQQPRQLHGLLRLLEDLRRRGGCGLRGARRASASQRSAFTDTGRWSDGWPVRRLAVETPRPEASTGQGPAGSTARR
jgi:hypothetical protein